MNPAELGLERFKAVEHAELRLAPITVLIGPNNSGKSTLLHALAILAQSIDQGDLVSRGSFLDLGQSLEVLQNRFASGQGFRIKVGWDETLPANHRLTPGRPLRVAFAYDRGLAQRGSWSATVSMEAPALREIRVMAQNSPSGSSLVVQAPEQRTTNFSFPQIEEAWPQNELSTGMPFGRFAVVAGSSREHDLGSVQTGGVTDYAVQTAAPYLSSRIAESLKSYRYIGAERQFSRSFYYLADTTPEAPMSADDLATLLRYDRPLREAVAERTAAFFGYRVRPEIMQQKSVDIEGVSRDRQAFSAVNMGSGFGQLVWIATLMELQVRRRKQDLITPMVGVEEPELHLHPGIQPKMAELLTTYMRAGLYIICTTQNEHLLIALLQAVASGKIESSDLAVNYVENGVIQPLKVDKFGRLSGGLKGFFEADEGELLDRLRSLMTRTSEGS